MRRGLHLLIAVVLWQATSLPGSVLLADEDDPPEQMSEEEREAARKRARELNETVCRLYQEGRYGEAEPLAREALRIRESVLGPEHPDLAESILNLGAQLQGLGRYDEARPLYERGLRVYEKALGPDHPDVAWSLNNLAALLQAMGSYDEARPLFERSLAIREKALGPDHPDVALALNNLAFVLGVMGMYVEALPLFERALAIRESALGPEHPQVATSLSDLARVHLTMGDYEAARPLFQRAHAIRTSTLGPEHPAVAEILSSLGSLWEATGHYDRALPMFERALEIWMAAFGPDHPHVGRGMNDLAGLLRTTGRYDRAGQLLERALEIARKAYGPDHPDVATSLSDLAGFLHDTGHYDRAHVLHLRALAIWEKALGPWHPDVAVSLSNLALLFRDEGHYARARPLFERALAIWERAHGPEHSTVALGLNNLATLLWSTGQYAEARPLLERARVIWEEQVGAMHPELARTLDNLASLHWATGRNAEARPLFERALEIREKTLGPAHPLVAWSLGNLAALYLVTDEHELARPLSERALTIREEAFGPAHPVVASSLGGLASLLAEAGQYEQARPLYERALRIKQDLLGPDHLEVAWLLGNLASIQNSLGRHDAAERLARRCLDIAVQGVRRELASLHGPQRHARVQMLRGELELWLRIASNKGRSGYEEALRVKGLVTRATAAERRLARRGGAQVTARVEGLRAAARRLAQITNSAPSAFPRDGWEERRKAWQKAYADASTDRNELTLAVARDFAALREGLERLDLTLRDVQARLSAGEVLLDHLRAEGRYIAWIVQAEGDPIAVDLGPAGEIEEAAVEFAERTARGGEAGEWLEAAKRLRALVFAPLEEHLGEGVETLYVCPDAALAAVPYAALPGRADGRHLLDDYCIVSVSMAQDLVPWPAAGTQARGALLLGDVGYSKASASPRLPITPTLTGVARVDRAPRGRDFLPLPNTRAEVEFIATRVEAGATMLVAADATEARFRAESRGRRVLHLATHGFVRDDLMRGLRRGTNTERVWLGADMERQLAVGHDPMNLAGLAMAGANPRDGGQGDDGILTAAEASYLDLDGVDLVVLSACETALGKAESGEGVIGLVRGFQMAGAKRVIASLWQVDDEATRLLMQHLYDGMLRDEDPLSAAEALREAARRVRGATGSDGQSFAAPKYWASFVCFGR